MKQWRIERRQREREKVIANFYNPPRNPWAPENPRDPICAELLPRTPYEPAEDPASPGKQESDPQHVFQTIAKVRSGTWPSPASSLPDTASDTPPAWPSVKPKRPTCSVLFVSGLSCDITRAAVAAHFGVPDASVCFVHPRDLPSSQAYIHPPSSALCTKLLKLDNSTLRGRPLKVRPADIDALHALRRRQDTAGGTATATK